MKAPVMPQELGSWKTTLVSLFATTAVVGRFSLVSVFAALTLINNSNSLFAANIEQGKLQARRVCAICHVVTEHQVSRDPNAPSFQSIAKSQQFRKKGASWLLEEHPKMPNLAITRQEAEDIAAYIKTLAK